jgi:hypothetical protein
MVSVEELISRLDSLFANLLHGAGGGSSLWSDRCAEISSVQVGLSIGFEKSV